MGKHIITIVLVLGVALGSTSAGAAPDAGLARASSQDQVLAIAMRSLPSATGVDCPIIIPDSTVTVAPGQPPVQPQSTQGIINALCEVTLNIVGCGFSPTSVSINCDANGDGVPELVIPLKDVVQVNNILTRATLAPLAPQLPGTAFPLACCGGSATITLSRTVSAGDDNIFGPFTQSQTCPIELGLRAPVVISASPADGDCSVGQDILLPGACYLLPDRKANVTSVFAVERTNPSNVIQANRFAILNANLVDAFFEFGAANNGKTFLLFASGPNGTSRNMDALPEGAPAGCPEGNEQGVRVTVSCNAPGQPPGTVVTNPAAVASCRLDRTPTGAFTLTLLTGPSGIRRGATVTVGGVRPKKIQFKNPIGADVFGKLVIKGKFCSGLPGPIVVTDVDGHVFDAFECTVRCDQ